MHKYVTQCFWAVTNTMGKGLENDEGTILYRIVRETSSERTLNQSGYGSQPCKGLGVESRMFHAARARALTREQPCHVQASGRKQVLWLHWIELGGKSKVMRSNRWATIRSWRALQGTVRNLDFYPKWCEGRPTETWKCKVYSSNLSHSRSQPKKLLSKSDLNLINVQTHFKLSLNRPRSQNKVKSQI